MSHGVKVTPEVLKQALEARKAGLTYRQIADKFGWASTGWAYTVVQKALRGSNVPSPVVARRASTKNHWRLVTPEKFKRAKELRKLGVPGSVTAKISGLGLSSIYQLEKFSSYNAYRTTTNSKLQKTFGVKQASQLPLLMQASADVALITRDEWESNKRMVRYIYEQLGGN